MKLQIQFLLTLSTTFLSQPYRDSQWAFWLLTLLLSGGVMHPVLGQNRPLPAAGVVNVKNYNVAGDGVTDDTQALQQIITNNTGRVIYFPAGIYRVTGRLEGKNSNGKWDNKMMLVGENQNTTVIKLDDNASGYSNRSAPKAVVYTASHLYVEEPYGGGKDYPGLGEGNEAFSNYVQNLTIDTGQGNPGAIGLDYLCNNTGAVRHVTIKGSGVTGLSMQRKWPGPNLIQNVTVQGFEYGIQIDQFQYGVTLEHITLSGQSRAGIRNFDNGVFIRNLKSNNSVPALQNNVGGNGFVVLIDGNLTGGASNVSAIENTGKMLVRNVTSSGYRSVVTTNGTVVNGSSVTEYTTEQARTPQSGSPAVALNLPVQDTPEYHEADLSKWANVLEYGATRNDWGCDDGAIQAALNSGKSVVYFPPGRYFACNTSLVPSTVRKIVGFDSVVAPGNEYFGDADNPKAMFRVQGNSTNPIISESLNIGKLMNSVSHAGLIGWENASSRTLVLKDQNIDGFKHSYRSLSGSGRLFIENVAAASWYFGPGQQVWARQYDVEGWQKIVNDGGQLWVLGLKTEGGSRIIDTYNNGKTEVLGAMLYPAGGVDGAEIAFRAIDSEQSLSFATVSFSDSQDYQTLVRETNNAATQTLSRAAATGRGIGRVVPLYTSAKTAAPQNGQNLALGKPTTASTVWGSGNFAANRATDGDVNTLWASSGNDATPTLQVDLGAAYRISQLEIVARQDVNHDFARRDFAVLASNDPSFTSSVQLAAQGSTPFADKGTWAAAVSETGNYRYLRVVATGGQRHFHLAELRAFEANFSGIYKIVARHSGRVLDVEGGPSATNNFARIAQYGYGGGTNQQWKLELVGEGYYKIVAQHSGKVLDVEGGPNATGDAAKIIQYEYLGGTNQQWKLESVGDGYYKITARHSGKVLDVEGGAGATADGVKIIQHQYNGGTNQHFKLESIPSN